MHIYLDSVDLTAIPEKGEDEVFENNGQHSEGETLFQAKRVNFVSHDDSLEENNYIEAFQETEEKQEKKRGPVKYCRTSTRPAPGTVKNLLSGFQNESNGSKQKKDFKESEEKKEKKGEPTKYSRSSTRPAPGTVKQLMTEFQK